jgi:transposase
MKELMAGLDLHSNNIVAGIVDKEGRHIAHGKLACALTDVLGFLDPFKDRLHSLAVESTFNWYWLVDGLKAHGFNVLLANPTKIKTSCGLKHSDDTSDAFLLAELTRLGILPTGYIYDPKLRPVRDLLRRRMSLVQHRTALLLSFKSLYLRTTGKKLSSSEFRELDVQGIQKLYPDQANQVVALALSGHIEQFNETIDTFEKVVLKTARSMPYYQNLLTLPGVGMILGMTITMEVGQIQRFSSPEKFASYCRTVDATRLSNGKKKGENNSKCGNLYLGWAFVEAATFARRYDATCRRWFDRKAAKTGTTLATKALACKIAKAAWYIMAKGIVYDATLMFPQAEKKGAA